MIAEKARSEARALLRDWFFQRLDENIRAWFEQQLSLLPSDHDGHILYTTFGSVLRRVGKQALELTEDECVAAARCIPGWKPCFWSLADAGRILVLINLPSQERDFAQRFRELHQTADVGEAVSLYRGLPLYPEPQELESQVGEGLRTNMRSVFEAIAHYNPYPRGYFAEHRWNHMVLKALFIGSRLAPIDGLDTRANAELARLMIDLVHERWAAGRPVPYELWRCIGPFAQGTAMADLERVLSSQDPQEKQAAALALSVCPDPIATELLARVPDVAGDIAAGRLNWATLQPL